MSDHDLGDNVVLLTPPVDPRKDMDLSDWARELCKTHLVNQRLPNAAIERKVARYSDEEMKMIGRTVFACIEKSMEFITNARDAT